MKMSPKLKSFLKILAKVGPLALALNPATAKYAPKIIELIGAAEKLPGASGPEKKAFVLAALEPVIQKAAEKHLKGFEPPELALATISSGIDTTIGAVKLLSGAKVVVTLAEGTTAIVPAPAVTVP